MNKDLYKYSWTDEDNKPKEETDKERIERIRTKLMIERARPIFGDKPGETDEEFLLRKIDDLICLAQGNVSG